MKKAVRISFNTPEDDDWLQKVRAARAAERKGAMGAKQFHLQTALKRVSKADGALERLEEALRMAGEDELAGQVEEAREEIADIGLSCEMQLEELKS